MRFNFDSVQYLQILEVTRTKLTRHIGVATVCSYIKVTLFFGPRNKTRPGVNCVTPSNWSRKKRQRWFDLKLPMLAPTLLSGVCQNTYAGHYRWLKLQIGSMLKEWIKVDQQFHNVWKVGKSFIW